MKTYSYLALGDSYTIGEQVPIADAFPYQTVQLLRKFHIMDASGGSNDSPLFSAPEIIAKTGWTTDDLTAAIGQTIFYPKYDVVSLLVGVNNQYRGKDLIEFENEFDLLLKMALQFADGIAKNVYVLSIPDWGHSKFAMGKDSIKISSEIDTFNAVCKSIAEKYSVNYINITNEQREDSTNEGFLAPDGLHPSAAEYKKWAIKLSDLISVNLG